jgi:thiol:disulfide interchange protein
MLCAVRRVAGIGRLNWMRLLKIAVGFVLLGAGAAMVVLPGPGWLTIVAGLAILAGEFPWARRALDRLKGVVVGCRDQIEGAMAKWRRS